MVRNWCSDKTAKGFFSTMQARDLQASAKLKEIQFSVTAMELLKSQVEEVEGKIKAIRTTLLILELLPPLVEQWRQKKGS